MSVEASRITIVGLPESGKSTFLGALFHEVQLEDNQRLRLASLPDERDYLIELESAWLSLRSPERNRTGPKEVELTLIRDGGGRAVLDLPDIAGEEHQHAWEHGGWEPNLADRLATTEVILLFVRADRVEPPQLIGEADAPRISQTHEWDPEESPTQAVLCDLLEQLVELRQGSLPPLALVLSAWDRAADDGFPPRRWLSWRLPLLDQWLRTNCTAAFEVFGLSAQGGAIDDEAARLELARSVERRPVPPNGSDLLSPIEWALDALPR